MMKLQQGNTNEFNSMCTDIWKKCLNNNPFFLTLTMNILDLDKIFQMHEHSDLCTEKYKKAYFHVFHHGASCTIQTSANRVSNLERC